MTSEANQFGLPDIPNSELTLDDVPAPYAEFWGVIDQFALTFDGYEHHPRDCGDIANRAIERYRHSGSVPKSLSELRTCLFFEQRR